MFTFLNSGTVLESSTSIVQTFHVFTHLTWWWLCWLGCPLRSSLINSGPPHIHSASTTLTLCIRTNAFVDSHPFSPTNKKNHPQGVALLLAGLASIVKWLSHILFLVLLTQIRGTVFLLRKNDVFHSDTLRPRSPNQLVLIGQL